MELQERFLQITQRMVALLTESLSPFTGMDGEREDDAVETLAVASGDLGMVETSEKLSIFKDFHRTMRELEAAGLLQRVLEAEAQRAMAPIAIRFLLDVAMDSRSGWRAAAVEALRLALQAPSWSQEFCSRDTLHQQLETMPAECAYLLRRPEGEGQPRPQLAAPAALQGAPAPLAPDACSSAATQGTAQDAPGKEEQQESRAPLALDACSSTASTQGMAEVLSKEEESLWSFLQIDKEHSQKVEQEVKRSVELVREGIRQRGARVVIMGNAGSGKSSCVNAAFHKKLAETGAGISVTSEITHYQATDECPIHIYDTKGFEGMSANTDVLDQFRQLVKERQQASAKHDIGDPGRVTERLHAVWYIIDVAGGGRFEPRVMDIVHDIFAQQEVPVLIVLNKCDCPAQKVDDVVRSVKEHCPWAVAVVEVAADPLYGPLRLCCHGCGSDDDMSISTKKKKYSCDECRLSNVPFKRCYGFDRLIQETADQLPDMVVISLLTAQKEWLVGLNRSANAAIAGYVAAAAGIGAAPLPFMSRLVIVPLHVAMVLTLAGIYELMVTKKTAMHILISVGSLGLFGSLACWAANGLKLVPGLWGVGAVSDAAISALTTLALGAVVKELFRRVRGVAIAGEVSPEEIDSVMCREEQKQYFREYFERFAAPIREIIADVRSMSPETFQKILEES